VNKSQRVEPWGCGKLSRFLKIGKNSDTKNKEKTISHKILNYKDEKKWIP